MSIGATLAAARRHAGLSVGDVSQRTRVRENIIESIEQDDYAACGGDFYARGHIRAIAQAVGADPAPLIEEFDATWRSTREITAAEAFQPSMPLRVRERRRVRGAAVLGVLVLAVLGFASYKFVAGAARTQRTAAVSTLHPPPRHPASAPAGGASVQASGSASPSHSAPASPSPTPSATPTPQALTPASVTAFGSGGAGDGDNPGQASLALSGNSATPWTSDWYATAQFGNLQSGTGLLVDMGQTVTINSVQLSLGDTSGADLQLRAGGTPVMSDLQTVATSSNAGGTVQLSLSSPAHARYLLIWFTQLPPDNAGTYQASIYNIAVKGQR